MTRRGAGSRPGRLPAPLAFPGGNAGAPVRRGSPGPGAGRKAPGAASPGGQPESRTTSLGRAVSSRPAAGSSPLADVLLGADEPGGRLPTTWPARLDDAPVREVAPRGGELHYDEGVFIGYRAWRRQPVAPAHPFGHGLGYTTWTYDRLDTDGLTARVQVSNTGDRLGRETAQLYLAPVEPDPERPERRLAGFAEVTAEPGASARVEIPVPPRAFQVRDTAARRWTTRPGRHTLHAVRNVEDSLLRAFVDITGR
ncbi:fibronectin type III-like domain-contianing protein [Kitasatospora sp. NPDC057692]|uniref:glycoside hydrolase family 3 protein n=1 Tax=Kitasatospora sp. NPDC057692 TaxID=3346215 RepID=UPI0036D0CA7E